MSLGSSLFLWGPWYQIKNMLKETRLAATLIMLAAIGCTLYIALYLDPKNRKKEKEDQKKCVRPAAACARPVISLCASPLCALPGHQAAASEH